MMASVRGKNTKPELVVRSALHRAGYRFRLHARKLPGTPDIVLPKYHVIIFVHGCFWHGHDCSLFRWPSSRQEFWKRKITTNQANDLKNIARLRDAGWRVLTVWECALKDKRRQDGKRFADKLSEWIRGTKHRGEFIGKFSK